VSADQVWVDVGAPLFIFVVMVVATFSAKDNARK
jgi:hypothetical protein